MPGQGKLFTSPRQAAGSPVVARWNSQRGLVVVEVDRAGGPLFQALTRCPACQTEAAALFLRAPTTALLFDLELTAEGLWCDLCQLRLETTEEVALAGIATT